MRTLQSMRSLRTMLAHNTNLEQINFVDIFSTCFSLASLTSINVSKTVDIFLFTFHWLLRIVLDHLWRGRFFVSSLVSFFPPNHSIYPRVACILLKRGILPPSVICLYAEHEH